MAEIAREVERHYPHALLRDRRLENFAPTIASSIAEAATRASAELQDSLYRDRHDDRQHGAPHRGLPPAGAHRRADAGAVRRAAARAALGHRGAANRPVCLVRRAALHDRTADGQGRTSYAPAISSPSPPACRSARAAPTCSRSTRSLKRLPAARLSSARACRRATSCVSPESIRAISASRAFAPSSSRTRDRRLVVAFDLVEHVVAVRHRSRSARGASRRRLGRARERADALADGRGGRAADAGVDLVEDQRAAAPRAIARARRRARTGRAKARRPTPRARSAAASRPHWRRKETRRDRILPAPMRSSAIATRPRNVPSPARSRRTPRRRGCAARAAAFCRAFVSAAASRSSSRAAGRLSRAQLAPAARRDSRTRRPSGARAARARRPRRGCRRSAARGVPATPTAR